MNISEALGWKKTLTTRHAELINLRNQNANRNRTRYGGNVPDVVEEPLYDVKALDKRVAILAREIRLLDEAIKRTNAQTEVSGFARNEEVLGELE